MGTVEQEAKSKRRRDHADRSARLPALVGGAFSVTAAHCAVSFSSGCSDGTSSSYLAPLLVVVLLACYMQRVVTKVGAKDPSGGTATSAPDKN